jgi:hypothetical protein
MARQAPTQALSAELRAVSNAAKVLREAIQSHNYLPSSFPTDVLALECQALNSLQLGSLQTAQVVLEHAIVRLSDVRRNHFLLSDDSSPSDNGNREDEETHPILERGDSLDREIAFLISAVSTALDGIRAQLQLDYTSSIADQYLDIVRGSDIHVSGDAVLSNTEVFADVAKAANENDNPVSQDVDELGRSAMDARSSILATAAESASKVVIAGWLRRLTAHSATALSALRLSVKVVKSTGGVTYEFYKKWQETLGRIEGVIVEEAFGWLNEIEKRLGGAEERLRSLVTDRESQFGITRYLQGQLIVLDGDGTPYSVDSEIKIKPLGNSVVTFLKSSRSGIVVATQIRQVRNVFCVGGKFLHGQEAKIEIERVAFNVLGNGYSAVSSKRFEKAMADQDIVPTFFWRTLGYNEFDHWAENLPGIHLYGDPSSRKNRFYAAKVRPFALPPLPDFLAWSEAVIIKRGGQAKLSDLASLAQEEFGAPKGVPIRALYKSANFGDLFFDDDRFVVEQDKVRLATVVPSPDSAVPK